ALPLGREVGDEHLFEHELAVLIAADVARQDGELRVERILAVDVIIPVYVSRDANEYDCGGDPEGLHGNGSSGSGTRPFNSLQCRGSILHPGRSACPSRDISPPRRCANSRPTSSSASACRTRTPPRPRTCSSPPTAAASI